MMMHTNPCSVCGWQAATGRACVVCDCLGMLDQWQLCRRRGTLEWALHAGFQLFRCLTCQGAPLCTPPRPSPPGIPVERAAAAAAPRTRLPLDMPPFRPGGCGSAGGPPACRPDGTRRLARGAAEVVTALVTACCATAPGACGAGPPAPRPARRPPQRARGRSRCSSRPAPAKRRCARAR
jgi:hypothetical protein